MKYSIYQNVNEGVAPSATGIKLASRFFWEIGLAAVESRFPDYVDRAAAGLFAAGSDCAEGDETARDFDWGPRFQVYLTQPDYAEIGTELQSVLDGLPDVFDGVRCRSSEPHANRVFSIDGFFLEKTSNSPGTGFAKAPESARDWLRIPEPCLFDITNGQVFYDPLGEFTERRRGFAAHYPDAAWRWRLAAALRECGRYGQGFLPRALARDDYFSAEAAWWRFVEAAMRLGFLLNRKYAPSGQWLYGEFCRLPDWSPDVANLLWDGQCDAARRPAIVEDIASIYGSSIPTLGLGAPRPNGAQESFIVRAEEVLASIADPEVASLAQAADAAA